MSRALWDKLLEELKKVHQNMPAVHGFCPFPDDIRPQDTTPYSNSACVGMLSDLTLGNQRYQDCIQAVIDCAPLARWVETYKHTNIGAYFLALSGTALFLAEGQPNQNLSEGAVKTHTANQPHALQTGDTSFLTYVVWRNALDDTPVLYRQGKTQ